MVLITTATLGGGIAQMLWLVFRGRERGAAVAGVMCRSILNNPGMSTELRYLDIDHFCISYVPKNTSH
jgi:hypothetical protein